MTVIYPETPGDGSGPRLRPTLDMFLTARYDELEALARGALNDQVLPSPKRDDGVWKAGAPGHWEQEVDGIGITIYDEGGHNREQALHIAQHDPAYVLADIAAKRRVVEIVRWADEMDHTADAAGPGDYEILQQLALPFSEHPDWREEWRP